jgi:hypothetical protein
VQDAHDLGEHALGGLPSRPTLRPTAPPAPHSPLRPRAALQHTGRSRSRPGCDFSAAQRKAPGHRRRRKPAGRCLTDVPLRNPEARSAVAAAIADADQRRGQALADLDDQREATWRERALNAEDALKTANAEILNQRTRIGELLGQIRDLQVEWTEEAIQRITTENTTLKQRVRQLTADNRTLQERLTAARANVRFQDRGVADLEAKLADPTTLT